MITKTEKNELQAIQGTQEYTQGSGDTEQAIIALFGAYFSLYGAFTLELERLHKQYQELMNPLVIEASKKMNGGRYGMSNEPIITALHRAEQRLSRDLPRDMEGALYEARQTALAVNLMTQ